MRVEKVEQTQKMLKQAKPENISQQFKVNNLLYRCVYLGGRHTLVTKGCRRHWGSCTCSLPIFANQPGVLGSKAESFQLPCSSSGQSIRVYLFHSNFTPKPVALCGHDTNSKLGRCGNNATSTIQMTKEVPLRQVHV